MKAVDTNILARFLLRDDEKQAKLAAELIASGPIYVPVAVLLELNWLLRSRFGLSWTEIGDSLSLVRDLPTVTVEADEMVGWALDRARSSSELADLLLIVSARASDAFVTFDGGIAKAAGAEAPIRVELLR